MSEKQTILIIDDELDIKKYLKYKIKSFKEKGIEFVFIETGFDAIEYLSKNRPSIIFLDVVLPPTDGYSICRVIKNNIETSHIPVILMSGKVSDELKVRYKSVDANDYLVKPFKFKDFLNKLELYSSLVKKCEMIPINDILPDNGDDNNIKEENSSHEELLSMENIEELFEELDPISLSNLNQYKEVNGNFRIKVSENAMICRLFIYPVFDIENYLVDVKDVVEFLNLRGVTACINEELIERKLEEFKKTNEQMDFVVAEGIPVDHGYDTHVILKFGKEKDKFQKTSDGSVDYKERNGLIEVKDGEYIGDFYRYNQGRDGLNVLGAVIPADIGRNIKIEFGEGIYLNNENKLFSKRDGYLHIGDNFYDVYESYIINSDVGIETGNINFTGNIVVKGNVCRGYSIYSQGEIIIEGNVEGAEIITNGDIIISGGIIGATTIREIRSGGEIEAKYIENCNVIAKKKITVYEGIINSKIYCGGNINVVLGKGRIIGGLICASNEIKCLEIGNKSEPRTEIYLGEDHTKRYKLEQLKKNLSILSSEMEIVHTVMKSMKKKGMTKEIIHLMQSQPKIKNFLKNYSNLKKNFVSLSKEKFELENNLYIETFSKIYCYERMYRNVMFSIAGIKKVTMRSYGGCKIYIKNNKIEIESTDPKMDEVDE